MNEKLKLGLILVMIGIVSIGSALWDTRHKSLNSAQWSERSWSPPKAQFQGSRSPNLRQEAQTTTPAGIMTRNGLISPSAEDESGCFKDEKASECDSRKIQHEVASFTFWLILIGAAQVIVAAISVGIYRLMRQDSTNISRAFVFIREFRQFWLHDPENEQRIVSWRIVPIWENSGNTIARKMKSYVNFCIFGPDIPDDFDFPDIGVTRATIPNLIGPHSTVDGGLSEIPVHTLVAIKKGMCNCYFWGWAEYVDIFGRMVHRVGFCNRLVVYGDPKSKACTFSFPFHSKHNGEDEDCHRRAGEEAPLRVMSPFMFDVAPDQLKEFGLLQPQLPPDARQ